MRALGKVVRNLLLIVFLIGIGGCAYFTCKGYGMYREAVEQVSVEQKVEEIRSRESYIRIYELPEIYKKAVVSVEDRRFYSHFGVDPLAILRAMVNNVKAMRLAEGGSGITQQLSKNLYFTQERTFERKIAEIFMSLELEEKYTKDEILELYVNSIYFGNNYYGITEASLGYFGKYPQEMNAYESTLLAGIPNAPSVYAPTENPELARRRQQVVLATMVEHKDMTEEEAKRILSLDSEMAICPPDNRLSGGRPVYILQKLILCQGRYSRKFAQELQVQSTDLDITHPENAKMCAAL